MLKRKHQLDVGSASIVGWVSANNEPRAASDVGDDPVHFKNELLPDTRAEVGIPISIGDTVLGVLDVQSTHPESFDEATISVLVTLSNQIATAIQNVSLFESSTVNLHELDRLYRASRDIAQEKTTDEQKALQAAKDHLESLKQQAQSETNLIRKEALINQINSQNRVLRRLGEGGRDYSIDIDRKKIQIQQLHTADNIRHEKHLADSKTDLAKFSGFFTYITISPKPSL